MPPRSTTRCTRCSKIVQIPHYAVIEERWCWSCLGFSRDLGRRYATQIAHSERKSA